MKHSSKVAVIGLGNIGAVVATNLVKGDRPVLVADKTLSKAQTLASKLGSLAEPLEIEAAIKAADIIVFAVYFDAIKQLFKTYATELQGKILVDPSNPIAPDENGGFKKIIDQEQSAGQVLAALLPAGAKLVKAMGSLSADSLKNKAFQQPQKAVLFYATDDTTIKDEIESFLQDNGFDPVAIGGIDQSIRMEVFGDLHEFGALGKTVTID